MDCIYRSPVFPPEILTEIVSYLPLDVLPDIAVVSPLFRALSIRRLYMDLCFTSMKNLLSCCETLAHHEDAAQAVRTLSFEIESSEEEMDDSRTCSRQSRLFRAALRNVAPHVKNLNVMALSSNLLKCIPGFFPRLEAFTTALPISSQTVSFVRRHTELAALQLFGTVVGRLPLKIHLPRLEVFVGPPDSMPTFLSDSRITRAGVVVHPYEDHIINMGDALSVFSRSKTMVLSLGFFGAAFGQEIFPSIAEHLPDLERLNFGGILSNKVVKKELYTGVENVLPLLKSLKGLEIGTSSPEHSTREAIEEEFRLLQKWSKLSDTLLFATLPTSTFWGRIGLDVWLPATGSSIPLEFIKELPEFRKSMEEFLATRKDSIPPQLLPVLTYIKSL